MPERYKFFPVFIIAIIMMFCFVLLPAMQAEGIYMKDGRVMYGRITFQDDYKIVVVTKYGKQTLQKATVDKISYDEGLGTVTVIMKGDRNVKGVLLSISNKKVVVKEEGNGVKHTINRKDIESLFLKKFEGRRYNRVSLFGGMNLPLGKLGDITPPSFLDFTFSLTRGVDFSNNFFWGANLSYVKLTPDAEKSPLENPSIVINPMMLFVEYRFPIIKNKLSVAFQLGLGVSWFTMSETGASTTSSYLTGEPVLLAHYALSNRFFIHYRGSFLYIYQETQPMYSVRNQIGIGFNF